MTSRPTGRAAKQWFKPVLLPAAPKDLWLCCEWLESVPNSSSNEFTSLFFQGASKRSVQDDKFVEISCQHVILAPLLSFCGETKLFELKKEDCAESRFNSFWGSYPPRHRRCRDCCHATGTARTTRTTGQKRHGHAHSSDNDASDGESMRTEPRPQCLLPVRVGINPAGAVGLQENDRFCAVTTAVPAFTLGRLSHFLSHSQESAPYASLSGSQCSPCTYLQNLFIPLVVHLHSEPLK